MTEDDALGSGKPPISSNPMLESLIGLMVMDEHEKLIAVMRCLERL